MTPILHHAGSDDDTLCSAAAFFSPSASPGSSTAQPGRERAFQRSGSCSFSSLSSSSGRPSSTRPRPKGGGMMRENGLPRARTRSTVSSRNHGSTGGVFSCSSEEASRHLLSRGTEAKGWNSCRNDTTIVLTDISEVFGCSPPAGPTEGPFCLRPSPFSVRPGRRNSSSEPRTPTEEHRGHGDGKRR